MSQTAAQKYAADQAACRALINRLERALAGHAKKAERDARNWGYVGDLSAVAQGLMQGLGMLDALTPGERERQPFL